MLDINQTFSVVGMLNRIGDASSTETVHGDLFSLVTFRTGQMSMWHFDVWFFVLKHLFLWLQLLTNRTDFRIFYKSVFQIIVPRLAWKDALFLLLIDHWFSSIAITKKIIDNSNLYMYKVLLSFWFLIFKCSSHFLQLYSSLLIIITGFDIIFVGGWYLTITLCLPLLWGFPFRFSYIQLWPLFCLPYLQKFC